MAGSHSHPEISVPSLCSTRKSTNSTACEHRTRNVSRYQQNDKLHERRRERRVGENGRGQRSRSASPTDPTSGRFRLGPASYQCILFVALFSINFYFLFFIFQRVFDSLINLFRLRRLRSESSRVGDSSRISPIRFLSTLLRLLHWHRL